MWVYGSEDWVKCNTIAGQIPLCGSMGRGSLSVSIQLISLASRGYTRVSNRWGILGTVSIQLISLASRGSIQCNPSYRVRRVSIQLISLASRGQH